MRLVNKNGLLIEGKKGDVKAWKEVGKNDKNLNEGVSGNVDVDPFIRFDKKEIGKEVMLVVDKGK